MDENPQQNEAPRERKFLLVRLLVWLPLVAFSACLLVFTLLQPALPGHALIPNTGGDPLVPPTLTPGPAPSIEAAGATPVAPTPVAPTPVAPGETAPQQAAEKFSYRDEAVQRITLCVDAFHAFFILEQTAFHNPDMALSDNYQAQAGQAMQGFRDACEPLGEMPQVPIAYQDVDRWLKLAAGEVRPATDTFGDALAAPGSSSASMEKAIDHMILFIEYTNRAQDLMERLSRRKNI